MNRFYLGTGRVHWLRDSGVPLFISAPALRRYRATPRRSVATPWALDSGGFSELSIHGRWTVSSAEYAREVWRWWDDIPGMDWAAVQDYMCEESVLSKTGLSVHEHQTRTIDSYVDLVSRVPHVRWLPVLQGWRLGDYLDHIDMYAARGIDLARLPSVGVGSVCRRQNTLRAGYIIQGIANQGIPIHAFGFKTAGLREVHRHVVSADSMAWSFAARFDAPMPGCSHRRCTSCRPYAEAWYRRLLAKLGKEEQR